MYSNQTITHGLIIDSPWIEKILNGEKRWEMRSTATQKRGFIALIKKGSGTIVGTARLVDCKGPLSARELAVQFPAHRIPQAMIEAPDYKWNYAWQLTEIVELERPIRYHHRSGAVIWVELDAAARQGLMPNTGLPRTVVDESPQTFDHPTSGNIIDPTTERGIRKLANSLGYEDQPLRSAGTHQIELSTIRRGQREFVYIARKVAIAKGELQVVVHPDVGQNLDTELQADGDIRVHRRSGTGNRTIQSSQYSGFRNKSGDGQHQGYAYRMPLNDGLRSLNRFLQIYNNLS